MKYILAYGFFFQKKSSFGIGYDEVGDEKALLRQSISRQHFFSLIERRSNTGLATDKYGDSEFFIQKMNSGILTFQKSYECTPEPIISYSLLKTPEGLYVGTWEAKDQKGLATLFTSECIIKDITLLADPLYVIDFLKSKGFQNNEIPFVEDFEKLKMLRTVTTPSDDFGDDLPF